MAFPWAAVDLLKVVSYDTRDIILYINCWVLLLKNCLRSPQWGREESSHLNFEVEQCLFWYFSFHFAWYRQTLHLRCLSNGLIWLSAFLTSFGTFLWKDVVCFWFTGAGKHYKCQGLGLWPMKSVFLVSLFDRHSKVLLVFVFSKRQRQCMHSNLFINQTPQNTDA